MGVKRRFELVEGTSSKFWEIEVSESSHTVTFGRIGTKGQSKTKSFDSVPAAASDAAKLVKEKTGKGYREVAGAAPAGSAVVSPPERVGLPDKKKPTPGTKTTLKGPRGRPPVIAVASGTTVTTNGERQDFASPVEAKRHVEQLIRAKLAEGYKLGAAEIVDDEREPEEPEPVHVDELEPMFEEPAVEPDDENGRFRITFEGEHAPDVGACRALAARIASEAPAVVHLICDFASPGGAWAKALAGRELPSVKAFIFDTYFQTQTRQGENTIGDLRTTLDAMPSLERLFATGALAITKGAHLTLRELYLLGNPLDAKLLRALATWRLPSLEVLVLSLGSDAALNDDGAALTALTRVEAPKLSRVYVDTLDDVPGTLDELVSSGRARQWKELFLGGGVDDEDRLIEIVEKHAALLRGLEVLGLPLDDVSAGADEKLRALCPSITDASEADPDPTLPAAYDDWR